jgi:tetratricopeptide (TPR) repeat protein
LLVTAAEAPRRLSPGSPAGLILIAYAAFVVFNYLSILWAAVPADAWAGANRALVFGLALALTATRPWSRDAGLAALALTGFGLLAVAVGTLAVGALGDPLRQFVEGRLSDPTGYANATAALCLMGAFPLLYLAAARALAWPLRGVALGGATTLVQVALLTQSRGAVVGLAVAGIVYLILVPQRWASLLCAGVVAALTALSFGVLTDLIDVGTATRFEARLDDARAAIALSAAVATALGAAGALVGVRLPTPGKALRRAGNWGLGAVAVGLAVAALVAIGSPGNWVDERWDDFRNSGYSKVDRGGSRFGGSLGSNRYDYYRVALDEFERHPVGGIGSENFLVPYLQQRRSTEAPHFPHSLAFRLLVQFGLVGTLSFSAFLGLALFGLGRALRRSRRVDTGICAAAFAVFAVWFAHGMVDWLWAFTGLGVIAFALLGVAIRCGDRARVGSAEAASAPGRQGLRRLTGAAALAFAAAVAVSLSLPWLAARYESAAYDSFAAGDVDLALDRFDRAAAMNFLSGEPLVAKGIVARRGGRPTVAIEAFEQGIGREHDNWLAHLELGMSLAAQGHRRRAETQIEIARRLNPGQVVLKRVLRLVEAGQTLNPAEVERDLNRQLTDNFRPL